MVRSEVNLFTEGHFYSKENRELPMPRSDRFYGLGFRVGYGVPRRRIEGLDRGTQGYLGFRVFQSSGSFFGSSEE